MLTYPFRYLAWLFASLRRALGKPPDYVLFLLENDPPALPDPPLPRWQRLFSKPSLSAQELGERFDLIARDSRTTGVVLHCLLYTSPSPRDRQKSRMPSS